MKAHKIYETIEFRQGSNPYNTMGIGSKALIDKWFKEWAPDVEYEIDLDLNINVKDTLDLYNTNITELPNNLSVGGDLDLGGTKISELPNNLSVGGSLYLRNTKISELPDNLKVGGYLNLGNTKITEVPDNLKVKPTIYEAESSVGIGSGGRGGYGKNNMLTPQAQRAYAHQEEVLDDEEELGDLDLGDLKGEFFNEDLDFQQGGNPYHKLNVGLKYVEYWKWIEEYYKKISFSSNSILIPFKDIPKKFKRESKKFNEEIYKDYIDFNYEISYNYNYLHQGISIWSEKWEELYQKDLFDYKKYPIDENQNFERGTNLFKTLNIGDDRKEIKELLDKIKSNTFNFVRNRLIGVESMHEIEEEIEEIEENKFEFLIPQQLNIKLRNYNSNIQEIILKTIEYGINSAKNYWLDDIEIREQEKQDNDYEHEIQDLEERTYESINFEQGGNTFDKLNIGRFKPKSIKIKDANWTGGERTIVIKNDTFYINDLKVKLEFYKEGDYDAAKIFVDDELQEDITAFKLTPSPYEFFVPEKPTIEDENGKYIFNPDPTTHSTTKSAYNYPLVDKTDEQKIKEMQNKYASWYVSNGDYNRQAKDPFTAVAQLIIFIF